MSAGANFKKKNTPANKNQKWFVNEFEALFSKCTGAQGRGYTPQLTSITYSFLLLFIYKIYGKGNRKHH
jgi:hypothetical protein